MDPSNSKEIAPKGARTAAQDIKSQTSSEFQDSDWMMVSKSQTSEMSTSSDEDTRRLTDSRLVIDGLKARLEHLQHELNEERMRTHGLNTIFQCYQEQLVEHKKVAKKLAHRKREVGQLKKQLSEMDNSSCSQLHRVNFETVRSVSESHRSNTVFDPFERSDRADCLKILNRDTSLMKPIHNRFICENENMASQPRPSSTDIKSVSKSCITFLHY